MTFTDLAAAAQEELDIAEEATGQAMVYMVGAIACGVLDAFPRARWLEMHVDPSDGGWMLSGDVIAADGEVIAESSDIPEGARALVSELDAHYPAWTNYFRRSADSVNRVYDARSAIRWLDLLRASQIRVVDTD